MMSILNEITQPKYDFGCVMLYFEFPEITFLHNMIDEKDIYTEEGDNSFGLEDEPHTTLLYGLHDGVTLKDVKNPVIFVPTCAIGWKDLRSIPVELSLGLLDHLRESGLTPIVCQASEYKYDIKNYICIEDLDIKPAIQLYSGDLIVGLPK
jgi:hypothetical protein